MIHVNIRLAITPLWMVLLLASLFSCSEMWGSMDDPADQKSDNYQGYPTIEVAFTGLSANGTSGMVKTTELTLTFDQDPTSLSIGDITVTGATKGSLTGTGTSRTLTISNVTVANGANVTVSLADPTGFTFNPSSRTVAVNTAPPVAFISLSANGTSGTVTTTELTLTFDKDPTSLATGDITVTGATKGALTGTGTSRTLAISDITVGNGANLTVALADPVGFAITPSSKTVAANVLITAVSFTGLSANGTSGTVTTTALTLTFDVDPTSLTASDISMTGATKGALSGTGTSRTLAVSDITVANGANLIVALVDPVGFTITPSSKTVTANVLTTPVSFTGLSANGTYGTVTTTALTLTFDVDPTSLTASDITVTRATKGTLSGSGTTRTLVVSDITVANGANLTVALANPAGFAISPASRTVAVNVDISPVMVSVPAGTFQRNATVTNTSTVSAFYMSEKEITRVQFALVIGKDTSDNTYSSGGSDPVQMVNWYHAIAFCNKLSIRKGLMPVYSVTGVNFSNLLYIDIPIVTNTVWDSASADWSASGYRLPTLMEWMWAAMGATSVTTGYSKAFVGSTGSNAIGDYAWYSLNSSSKTHPAGSKLPNELGLYDMSGNVWEWNWDWDDPYPVGGALIDYRGPTYGSYRVVRGGSSFQDASSATVAHSGYATASGQSYGGGFRVVRAP